MIISLSFSYRYLTTKEDQEIMNFSPSIFYDLLCSSLLICWWKFREKVREMHFLKRSIVPQRELGLVSCNNNFYAKTLLERVK